MKNELTKFEKEFGLKLNEKGEIVVDSITVAEKYGKEHRNVLSKIDGFIKLIPELGVLNFKQTPYIAKNGETYRMYIMNRQGFSILVNKFTGIEALKFTYKYTQAFEEMAKEIKRLESDNKELYNTAISDKELKDRQYQADKVYYAINNIEKRLSECDYTNIVSTVDKIVDVHTNLYVKDRYKAHQNTDKYGFKGDIKYINHVKSIIENKLDKLRPQMTLRDSNINSIILSKARQLHKEIEASKNISDGREKKKLEKQNKNLQNKIDKLDPSLEEMYCINYHPFSWNYALENGHRTYSYNNWINNFPITEIPNKEMWELDYGVDFNKPIKIFIRYINKSKFDMDNLSKSLIDRLFNEYRGVYEIDDSIIHAKDEKTIGHCNTYDDGKIYFFIQNMSENEIRNIEYEVI